MQTGHEWIEAFAVQLGADAPDAETLDKLLELAGVAAHSSERWAAPLACYLVGLTLEPSLKVGLRARLLVRLPTRPAQCCLTPTYAS